MVPAREKCSFAVERDRKSLEWMYPASDPRTRIFLVEQGSDPVGWGVCFDTQMAEQPLLRQYARWIHSWTALR